MSDNWAHLVSRWTQAGLIDDATAARIRAYEEEHPGSPKWRWPVWLALAFGGLMIGAGVLLFVSAYWDVLSPLGRFSVVLAMVALFHMTGALLADRTPGLSMTLHAVGTVAFGAGIFLSGQIFNLNEHWPSGVLLWAIGAGLAWALLRQWPQMVMFATLAPAWLASEWSTFSVAHNLRPGDVPIAGIFLLALVYFTSVRAGDTDVRRRALLWLGGLALPQSAIALAITAGTVNHPERSVIGGAAGLAAWSLAFGAPLAIAAAFRGRSAWHAAAAALWIVLLFSVRDLPGGVASYLVWALGAVGLAAWGVEEGRPERINMGAAIFAGTVLAFYFSRVMDKMGRSASLIGLGLLCLVGGWALERGRRQLVHRGTKGGPA